MSRHPHLHASVRALGALDCRSQTIPDIPAKSSQPAPVRIIEAAKSEFARHGLSGARIDEIAKLAGVSQQLVFHYFRCKEELYEEALSSLADESAKFVHDVDFDGMHPIDAIVFILRGIFEANQSYGARFIADQIVQGGAQISSRNRIASYHSRLEEIIETILCRGRLSGDFSAAIGSRDLLIAMISLSMGQSAALDLLGLAESGSSTPAGLEWTAFGIGFVKRALTNLAADDQVERLPAAAASPDYASA